MAIGDALKDAGVEIPSISMEGASNIFLLIIGIVVIGGIILLLVWKVAKILMFNKRVVVFKDVNGEAKQIGSDRGMFQRIGMAGDYWLVTRKFKKFLAYPKIEIRKNTFWYFVKADGEWLNFSLGSFNDKLKQAGVKFIDSDMALSRVAIERNLKDRLLAESFWDKYGDKIMFVIYATVLLVFVVIVMQKTASNIEMLTEFGNRFLERANNINLNSGVVPA